MSATLSNEAPRPPANPRLAIGAALLGVVAVGAAAAWLGWREPGSRWPLVSAWAGAAKSGSAGSVKPPPGASPEAFVPGTQAPPPAQPSKTRDGSTAAGAAGAIAASSTGAAEGWPLWEFQLKQPVAPRDPPLTPPNWRLVGASNDGRAWQLIVLRQGNPQPFFYKVGESLPGGFRIEAITEEDVTLKQRQRRLVLSYIGY